MVTKYTVLYCVVRRVEFKYEDENNAPQFTCKETKKCTNLTLLYYLIGSVTRYLSCDDQQYPNPRADEREGLGLGLGWLLPRRRHASADQQVNQRKSEATHAGIRTRSNGTVDDGWDGSHEAKVCMLQFSSVQFGAACALSVCSSVSLLVVRAPLVQNFRQNVCHVDSFKVAAYSARYRICMMLRYIRMMPLVHMYDATVRTVPNWQWQELSHWLYQNITQLVVKKNH